MDPQARALIALGAADDRFVANLDAVRRLGLRNRRIGAGAVRNLVWDALHEKTHPSPLADVDVAIASWPEFATCVAVTIDRGYELRVIAPHGLDDLFSMTIRRNPARVGVATYRARIGQKRYGERWPRGPDRRSRRHAGAGHQLPRDERDARRINWLVIQPSARAIPIDFTIRDMVFSFRTATLTRGPAERYRCSSYPRGASS